jgi:hypothetical protein
VKYHDPKIAPARRMSFNPTSRGMSVLRATQNLQAKDLRQLEILAIERNHKMLTMREHNLGKNREGASELGLHAQKLAS